MAGAAEWLDLITFANLTLPPQLSGKPKLISNYPAPWFDRRCFAEVDVAPSFYPVLSSFPAWVVPCWAGEAT
ncbi:MAG: hypothetical protein E5X72_29970, partial [Mesorhizobium sp.]